MNKLTSRKIKKAQFGVLLKANPTENDFNVNKVNKFMHNAYGQNKKASQYALEVLDNPDLYKPKLVKLATHYTNFANLPEEQFNSGDPEGDAMYNRLLNGSTITGSINNTYGTDEQTNNYHYLQTTEQGDSIWSGNSNGTNYHIYKNGVTGQYGYNLSNGDALTKISLEQIPENIKGFMVSSKNQAASHKQGAKLIKRALNGDTLVPQTTIHGMRGLRSDGVYKLANLNDRRQMRQQMRNDGSVTVNYDDWMNANLSPEDIAMSKRMDDKTNVKSYSLLLYNENNNNANSFSNIHNINYTDQGDIVAQHYNELYDELKGKGKYNNYFLTYNSDTDRYNYEIDRNGRTKHRENVKFNRLPSNFLQQLNTHRANLQ